MQQRPAIVISGSISLTRKQWVALELKPPSYYVYTAKQKNTTVQYSYQNGYNYTLSSVIVIYASNLEGIRES